MNTNKYIILKDKIYIIISGPDSNVFLQGMITNDINKCSENQAIYSAFLTPQGKFVADFFILKFDESYLLEVEKNLAKNLTDKLNIFSDPRYYIRFCSSSNFSSFEFSILK